MGVIIKKMETDAEIKGKAYVHWKAWQEAYPGIVPQKYLDGLTLEKCETIAYRWPDNILVAKDGEDVVGFAGYGKCRNEDLPDAGEVSAIYILAAYYGQGVGRRLMEETLKRLDDYPRVALWVLKENKRAIRFYEKCGFRLDGREETIKLDTPVQEVRMIRERGPARPETDRAED
ncbi:MAG: GNAT family N-acetyltransferase [Clostridia bacterium]|nr:GNAT family N-acetyltransferase [Clostridia bacterium]